MTREQIEAAIPHRPPMLLLDEIVEWADSQIVCSKSFRDDEHFVQGHYPGQPIVPGVILCEVALQSGAVLLSRRANPDGSQSGGTPVVTKLSDARFRQMVSPGDTVLVQTELLDHLANAFVMRSKMTRQGKNVMRVEFTCALASEK